MSSYTEMEVRCDRCRAMAPIRLWRIVDVGSDPELKAPLLAGELHSPGCPSCGAALGFQPLSFVYADPENRLLAWCSCFRGPAPDPRSLLATADLHSIRLRAVRAIKTLAETVRILEDGLDDAVVQIMKGSIQSAMADLPGGAAELTYAGLRVDGGRRKLAFQCAALPGMDVMPDADAYDEAKAKCAPRIAALLARDPWLWIDEGLAARVEAAVGPARQASPPAGLLERFLRRHPPR